MGKKLGEEEDIKILDKRNVLMGRQRIRERNIRGKILNERTPGEGKREREKKY